MVKKVEAWQAEDGKQFPTQVEAEHWDRRCKLVSELEAFCPKYAGDDFEVEAAANWLLDTYSMTELPK